MINELNILRGGLSLLVVIGHTRSVLLVDYSASDTHNLGVYILYGITSLGGYAVLGFIMLSGYLVGGKVINDPSIDYKSYLYRRIVRIYSVLIPCIIFTFFISAVALQICGEGFECIDTRLFGFGPNGSNVGVLNLIATFFSFQGIFIPVHGFNQPLWSLAFEVWFYVFFPVVVLLLAGRGKGVHVVSLLLLVFLMIANHYFAYYFMYFISGAVFFSIKTSLTSIRSLILVSFVGSCVVVASLLASRGAESVCFVVFYILVSCSWANYLGWVGDVFTFLGRISFSMYVVHMPVLLFVVVLFDGVVSQLQFGLLAMSYFIFIVSIILIFSYVFYVCFEKRNLLKALIPMNTLVGK